MRRWRGMKDVPLSAQGREQVRALGDRVDFDLIYHDGLSRCKDTAEAIPAPRRVTSPGPRPWRMGTLFEGREITPDSLRMARHYVTEPYAVPPDGESFHKWSGEWDVWLQSLRTGFAAVGVVTHNRNIQYLYSTQSGRFDYSVYDCDGPGFCSVHLYEPKTRKIAEWDGNHVAPGLYMIRHGETEWGT